MEHVIGWFNPSGLPVLMILGIMITLSFIVGKFVRLFRMEPLLGYLLFGMLAGPSLLNIIDTAMQRHLYLLAEIALGFIALGIGMELQWQKVKTLGSKILTIIFWESAGAFLIVSLAVWAVSSDLILGMLLGAIAQVSAPSGTVSVIRDYRTKGRLTHLLYGVVGHDDSFGIILFSIVAIFCKFVLIHQAMPGAVSTLEVTVRFFLVFASSALVGILAGFLFLLISRGLKTSRDLGILIFGMVLITCGISVHFDLSVLLVNFVFGIIVVNSMPKDTMLKIQDRLPILLPMFYVVFFTLAGSYLKLNIVPVIVWVLVVYILGRILGLITGAWIGTKITEEEPKIRHWLGWGILSQAGVAIGLALETTFEFQDIGPLVTNCLDTVCNVTRKGDYIGTIVITVITTSSFLFESIGPQLTRMALLNVGEIDTDDLQDESVN